MFPSYPHELILITPVPIILKQTPRYILKYLEMKLYLNFKKTNMPPIDHTQSIISSLTHTNTNNNVFISSNIQSVQRFFTEALTGK